MELAPRVATAPIAPTTAKGSLKPPQALAVATMVLVGHLAARQLCMGLGYIYPLYASVDALRTRKKHELLQWITFWAVNALFWVVEMVGDTVISWVPFYLEAKIVALAWLVLPSHRGALVLHQRWLAPAFQQHEEAIDLALADLKQRAGEKMVQVCRDTAVIALRNSSDVVAQSQQYVAAQLVQQALGKLQAAIPADNNPPSSSETLRLPSPPSEAADSKCRSDSKLKLQSEAKQRSLPRSLSSESEDKSKPGSSRGDKSKNVLEHFKKLLVRGFQLKYYPLNGAVKHRALLLESVTSRYVSFVSATDVASMTASDTKKKAARLLLLNLRRVSSAVAEESATFAELLDEDKVDATRAFVLDNGKAVMLFEADSQKSRDLLVAGTRLLINEHKKRDMAAIKKLCAAFKRVQLRQSFHQMLVATDIEDYEHV